MSPDLYQQLHWRYIGPEGNRFSAAAGVPGNPHVYYVGAASGGIYKTTDGGVHWAPMFDDQPVQSIGALAVARTDPNIVWAGTGEGKIRSHISVGQGVYKSTDAGRTWTLMGLEQTARVPRLVIHPQDPNVVLVCALGHAYGPQPERGVFRTADGGKTWSKVLFVDENTGCSDIAMDPNNPRDPLRRHVAARDPHLGPRERRARQRALHLARRRASPGSGSRGTVFPPNRSARSRWRSRRRTPTASTP